MSVTTAAQAERHAERLRQDLAGTLEQIVDNLAPANLAAEALAATRDHAPDWLKRYWTFARSPTGLSIVGGALALAVAGSFATRQRSRRLRR